MEYLRIFVDEIDRGATPGMAIAIDYEEAIGGKVIIVRVIDFPKGIGSPLYHTTPIIGNQFACFLAACRIAEGLLSHNGKHRGSPDSKRRAWT